MKRTTHCWNMSRIRKNLVRKDLGQKRNAEDSCDMDVVESLFNDCVY